MPFLRKTNKKRQISVFRIPKIKETHHTAKQLAIPRLFQFEVDIAGAAAKHVELIEKIVRPPFMHLRLDIALADRHLWGNGLTHLFQILTHGLLALDETGIHDVGTFFGGYGVGEIHFQYH